MRARSSSRSIRYVVKMCVFKNARKDIVVHRCCDIAIINIDDLLPLAARGSEWFIRNMIARASDIATCVESHDKGENALILCTHVADIFRLLLIWKSLHARAVSGNSFLNARIRADEQGTHNRTWTRYRYIYFKFKMIRGKKRKTHICSFIYYSTCRFSRNLIFL